MKFFLQNVWCDIANEKFDTIAPQVNGFILFICNTILLIFNYYLMLPL